MNWEVNQLAYQLDLLETDYLAQAKWGSSLSLCDQLLNQDEGTPFQETLFPWPALNSQNDASRLDGDCAS